MSHRRIMRVVFIGLGIALALALAANAAKAEEEPISGPDTTILTLSRTSVDITSEGV